MAETVWLNRVVLTGLEWGGAARFCSNIPNPLFPFCVSTVINETLSEPELRWLEGPNCLLPARGGRARHCINSVAQTNRINGHRVGRGGAFLQKYPQLVVPFLCKHRN